MITEETPASTTAARAKFRAAARAHRLAGLVATAALVALPSLWGARAAALLRYERRAIASGEWWRLLSCHFVHFNARHLALNLAGLGLLWSLFVAAARPRDWLVVSLAAALAVGAGLYALEPQVAWYVGLSGVLHGVWAAAAVFTFVYSRRDGIAVGALLVAKLAAEHWHGALSAPLDRELPVIVAAHLYGALGGLAVALALARRRAPL